MAPFPVIDLFAGPGGLGEGFSALDGGRTFSISVSFEMEAFAHRTLTLRAFYRQFACGAAPDAYYSYLRGEIEHAELSDAYPDEWTQATREARRVTLGKAPRPQVRSMIDELVGPASLAGDAVLIGGPPCQAYSLVGRSRMRPGREDEFEEDHRHLLYREYLRILADHAPAIFVMENVKGLLSSRHAGNAMFERILADLRAPGRALRRMRLRFPDVSYCLVPLGTESGPNLFGEQMQQPADFVLRGERLGLPQARHRVIILGIREGRVAGTVPPLEAVVDETATVDGAIGDLPALRSGISHGVDADSLWLSTVRESARALLRTCRPLTSDLRRTAGNLEVPYWKRGRPFIPTTVYEPRYRPAWFVDHRLAGVTHHETRGHMPADLTRYLFAATFAREYGRSPHLGEFPAELLPLHRNVSRALSAGLFSDRFRVQVATRPSTTVTSHISKDGHYFIHPDPLQCRSLTVREAARLQTFPDNYFFEGPRTSQYVQVGNAVPPLLALQVARVVARILGRTP